MKVRSPTRQQVSRRRLLLGAAAVALPAGLAGGLGRPAQAAIATPPTTPAVRADRSDRFQATHGRPGWHVEIGGADGGGGAGGFDPRATGQELPTTGLPVPELAAFDQMVQRLMARWQLPGGQLALAKDARLVFNRGYGLADVERGEVVQPTALFRIASVSKPFTGVAVLKIIDDGRLQLDDRAFPLLDNLPAPPGSTVDPRLDAITIQHLLQHSGGWNSVKSFDPQYPPWSVMASHRLGGTDPASAPMIVRFMRGMPLDFDPGTRTAYSNFGYNVLGRVIERVTGQGYEQYVQGALLLPTGIADMQLGRTRPADRQPGEVRYYAQPGTPPTLSVYPGEADVPLAYGSYYMEALDAHGGWVASAADLVRFALAVDGQRGPALLRPQTVRQMLTSPKPPPAEAASAGAGNAEAQAGMIWVVRPVSQQLQWDHAGALEGSNASWLARRPDGVTIGIVFNSLPTDFVAFFGELVPALTRAADAVATWPVHDLSAAK